MTCRDCSEEFIFSAGEQTFFASKGLVNDPQRCPSCRAAAKRARTVGGPREFHAAVCGACGGQAIVQGGGKVGEAIFEASLGVVGLRNVRNKLQAECDAFFKPGGKKQRISETIQAYHAAVVRLAKHFRKS